MHVCVFGYSATSVKLLPAELESASISIVFVTKNRTGKHIQEYVCEKKQVPVGHKKSYIS